MTDAGPVPLHLPAILQNPSNKVARQVESHNAQQREKVAARRERLTRAELPGNGKGKRVIRRKDNAAFTFNPYIAQPKRSDFFPPVPFQQRSAGPAFPTDLPSSSKIPSTSLPPKDPFSADSRSGAFSTSLKGVRGLLRKRGRRAEKLIQVVEGELRKWVGGEGWVQSQNLNGATDEGSTSSATESSYDIVIDGTGWMVIDPSPVNMEASSSQGERGVSRRLPSQHRNDDPIPPLPVTDGQIPAVLELSRSPAHLSWYVADSFERLVVHLLARYYELVSWSESAEMSSGEQIRLTHIIVPRLIKPISLPASHALLTPENSDLSATSASEPSLTDDSDLSSASDTETEIGYSLDPDESFVTVTPDNQDNSARNGTGEGEADIPETPNLEDAMAELELRQETHSDAEGLSRVWSHGSSAYGSSEGGSEWDSMADSLTLPPPPNGNTPEGWTTASISDVSSEGSAPAFRRVSGGNGNMASNVPVSSWEDRPTFFDYLYGE